MKPYRPSNGSEGEMFQEAWCSRCIRDRAAREGRPEDGCDILSRTMVYMADDPRYPKEWVWDPEKMLREGALTIGGDDGGARCTAFELEGKLKRVICDTHHAGGGAYYKDECPSCLAASPESVPPDPTQEGR